jgi:hypothetical protein
VILSDKETGVRTGTFKCHSCDGLNYNTKIYNQAFVMNYDFSTIHAKQIIVERREAVVNYFANAVRASVAL